MSAAKIIQKRRVFLFLTGGCGAPLALAEARFMLSDSEAGLLASASLYCRLMRR